MSGRVCIYGLVDPRDNRLRYIGKANNPRRRLYLHLYDQRKQTRRSNWLNSLKTKGLEPVMFEIIWVPVSEWVFWEKFFIAHYRETFSDLVNTTSGGDGGDTFSGKKHSGETREKMRLARREVKSKPLTEEHKNKLRIIGGQRRHTEEEKRKIGLANSKRVWSAESRERARLSHLGQPSWNKGKKMNAAALQANRDSHKGKVQSAATRKKRSDALKQYWARKRVAS